MTPTANLALVTALTQAAAVGMAVLTTSSAGAEPDREGLLLEYRFDGSLADSSGGGHDGTAQGAPGTPVFVPGREGQCLALDGAGLFIDSGTNLPGLTHTFSVECWVRPGPSQRPYADIFGNHHNNSAGFALQQDGGQTNRYYFTYGTGSAWVYSRSLPLTADQWQHVAVVKTPDRLRVYLNGMLADTQTVTQPMVVSPTHFMVGLGIAAQPRWFNGQVAEVRAWSVARSYRPLLSEAEQIELFAKTAALERTPSSRWYLFACGPGNTIELALDPERVPASIETVDLRFEARAADGQAAPFAEPVRLLRTREFRASVAIPPAPGFRRVTCRASIATRTGPRDLPASSFCFLVLTAEGPEPVALPRPAAPARPATARAGVAPVTLTLDGQWLLAPDPQNQGRDQQWWRAPAAEAKPTKVPWIIQDVFPGYHGVAWYWHEFTAPANPHPQGRCLLCFDAVDYKAEVWLNDTALGGHEGGETPFVLDVTDSLRPGAANRLAVRVLNPTHQPIDGMTLNQTPRRAKVIPYSAGASYNHGGIVGSVRLLAVPPVYIEDLYLWPDLGTGTVRAEVRVRRAAGGPGRVRIDLQLAAAVGGETLDATALEAEVPEGSRLLTAELRLDQPRTWELNDPYLYRVAARISETGAAGFDERSARCGFRDFRFSDGYFRLNGRRLILRSAHTVNATPVGQQVPHDPDLFRRDLLYLKTMNFNCIRFIWGGATPAQLDLCDELGLLVYAESAAANPIADSPEMPDRFDRSVAEMIRRDRNHPSVVIWGLLNETPEGPVFRHATGMLPLVRSLDETRLVALNSGRWDGCLDIGSFCNPGATGWDAYLGAEGPTGPRSPMAAPGGYTVRMGDVHAYPRVPHTADTMRFLRTLGHDTAHVFLSEYGIGSAVDLWRVTRRFEQMGKPEAEDAQFYRDRLACFLADWERWRLAEGFASPQDFFAQSLRKMAGQRTLGLNAIRSNPNLVGHNLTGMMDHVNCGEGLFTLFRELKPGTVDALFEAFAPLRLCLFAEPVNLVRGERVRLEGVLANEDALAPGEYPVHLQVLGPDMTRRLDRTVAVTVPATTTGHEPPLAIPFFAEDLVADGPPGRYRFLAEFERGGAPTGGETEFCLDDLAGAPAVEAEVVLWGDDPELARWLTTRGIRNRPPAAAPPTARELILAAATPANGGANAWRELAGRMARGSTVVFLSPAVFREGENPVARLPLQPKGTLTPIYGWLYLKDEWAKAHPIFAGLPAGGLLDYTFYRELIPDLVFAGQEPPAEAVAGAIKASQDYASGLMLSVYPFGAGRFILNTLLVRENLGHHPAAERLLRNLLRYGTPATAQPLADLPADFEAQLAALGYR